MYKAPNVTRTWGLRILIGWAMMSTNPHWRIAQNLRKRQNSLRPVAGRVVLLGSFGDLDRKREFLGGSTISRTAIFEFHFVGAT
jgi:hypothetical protein